MPSGNAGGADAVGDEDDAVFAFGGEEETDHDGVDVDAVADDLGEEGWLIEDEGGDAGLAVVECTHGVEGVGGGGCSGVEAGEGLRGGGVAVAQAAADAEGGRCVR